MIDYLRNHKLVAGISLFLLLILIATAISLLQNSQPSTAPTTETTPASTPSSTDTIPIENWSDTVQNLSDDERDQVQARLYQTLALNFPTIPADIQPEIRAGSYHQTYNPTTQIYITEFLIDIPSIQQTYRVVDQYSDLPVEQSGLYDYTTRVFCPTAAELIWPAFDCTDAAKIEQGG